MHHSSMLEKAEDRDVTLLDIATLCISQSVLLQHHSPPTTTNLDSHSSSGNNAVSLSLYPCGLLH